MRTNVLGTQFLLDAARAAGIPRFVQVSTDEVYGSSARRPLFTEETPLAPNSPYAASKAAADLLVRAATSTRFGLPTVITRCSNNYGPYQFPEKLIPLFITNAAGRHPGAGLRRRPASPRLDPRARPLPRASPPPPPRARRARSTTSAAGANGPTST